MLPCHTPSQPFCSGLVRKVSIHPKFITNMVTQSPEDLAFWRHGTSGYRRHPIQGLQKDVSQCWMLGK